jgi:hypothetical protein
MLDRSSFGAIAIAAALWATAAPAQIVDMGKFPDWAGQWRRVPDGGPPRYDPSKPNGPASRRRSHRRRRPSWWRA